MSVECPECGHEFEPGDPLPLSRIGTRYSEKEDEYIIGLYKQDLTNKEIANKTGRDEETIKHRFSLLRKWGKLTVYKSPVWQMKKRRLNAAQA